MISIILPTYNSSPWLGRCLESVVAQTLTDWELIAIDDGSSDSSAEIIDSFASADPRIRLLRMEHRGVAHVRNVGIAESRGEYIAFIDSDDLWAPASLGFLMGILTDNEAEIACGSFIFFNDIPKEEQKAMRKAEAAMKKDGERAQVVTGTEAVRESLYQRGVNSSLCGKLYRREALASLRMNPGEIYEDLDLFYRIALRAQRIAVSRTPVYLYRQRKGSIIHTFTPARLDVLDVTKRMQHTISYAAPELMDAAIDRRFSANFNMLQEITKHSGNSGVRPDEKVIFEVKAREIREFLKANSLKELRNGEVRLKNRLGALLYLTLPYPLLKIILRRW
ncbi:MAG: glycosyltransferase [Muribaculaceae bacterium]|nr:glycosyltransferase [Muribaculaceae bacterium]